MLADSRDELLAEGVFRAPELERLFAPRKTGYLGADAALSVPLPDGRTLWLFGDTLLGAMDGRIRTWTGMPRNSAVVLSPGDTAPEKVEWILRGSVEGRHPGFLNLPPEAGDQWFWPGTALCIGGELFVFGYGVTHGPGECEALAFLVVGPWLLRARDISGPPEQWRFECEPVTWGREGDFFCSANIVDGGCLYLLGLTRRGKYWTRGVCARMARVRVDELLEHGAACGAEVLLSAGPDAVWSDQDGDPAVLFEPGVTESSLYFDAPRNRFLVTTYRPARAEYLVSAAPRPEGPWSEPKVLFSPPEGIPREKHLFYALRMHPHLARNPYEMVFTYIVNARDPADLQTDAGIYYPRFVRADLRRI